MSKLAKVNWIVEFLLLIAVAALFYYAFTSFRNQEEQVSERVIVVNFWNPSSAFSLYPDSTHSLPFDSTQGAFKKICLTGIEKSDRLKMIEIKETLTCLSAKKDLGLGIHLVFGGNLKYRDFIEILNCCLKENIRRYIPYKNNLWIPANESLLK